MSYSSLATKAIISPNYNKRTVPIDSISIHCACSNISLDKLGELYKDPERNASANYGIDTDGNIAVFVDEKNASICTSNSGVDNRSISILITSTTSSSPYPASDFTYLAMIDLLVDICIRNNIDGLKWQNAPKYARAAAAGGPVTDQNIFIHSWFKDGVVDPGQWVMDHMNQLVTDTNAQLVRIRDNQRRVVFLGDKRADAMHKAIGIDSNLWIISQTYAFSWIGNTTQTFEYTLNSKSAVCILGSPLDINYIKAKDYANKINSYATNWVQKGCSVFYVSITPVSRSGYNGITNDRIKQFNSEMRNNLLSWVGYIDAYSAVESSFIVPDGYNYDDNTNKEIYGTIIAQASRVYGGIRLNSSLNLNPTNFHPYIVMFGRDANVNYQSLQDLRVVGALIEAGYRYRSAGVRADKFDNPNIETQISSLDKYEIPYGLYTICRAKTTVESKTEMDYFKYQLYRHPPKLGAWLFLLELSGNKTQNDSILKQYNESLTSFGLRGKMGIICTRTILKNISWDTWQNEFYLYLVDHTSDLSVLDNLLDPALFDTDGS